MEQKHGVTSVVADEALGDADRVVIDPDYNSISGRSVRIIGFSDLVGNIVTVIVMEADGIEYGVNGWLSNERDRGLYRDVEGGTDGQEDR